MDVSIIIVNYNTCELTCNCINSIVEHTKDLQYEIIVVDNASKDESCSMISNIKGVIFIRSNENLGFGRANNLGVQKARGRNILFLNSDTVIISNSIYKMSSYLDAESGVGAVGVNIINGKGEPTYSYSMMRPSVLREINDFLGKPGKWVFGRSANYNYSNKPKVVKQIVGADLMVKKNILDRFTYAFNPRFFLYYEENELCFRINKSGYLLVCLPDEKIVHLQGYSTVWNENRIRIVLTSRHIYYDLTHGKFYHSVANLFWRLTIYSRLLLHKKSKKSLWQIYNRIERELSKSIYHL